MKTLKLSVIFLISLMTTNVFGFAEDRTIDAEFKVSRTKDGFTISSLDQKTKQVIIARVAAATGMTTVQTSKAVPVIINALVKNTLKKGAMTLVGFGSFSISKSFWNGADAPPKQITVGDELPSGIKLSFTLDDTTSLTVGDIGQLFEIEGFGVPASLMRKIMREDDIIASKVAELISQTIGNIIAVELDAGFSTGQEDRMDASFSNRSGVVFILDRGEAGDNVAHSKSCNLDIYQAISGLSSGPDYNILAWSDEVQSFDYIGEGKGDINIRKLRRDYDCLVYPGDFTKYTATDDLWEW